jgi:hypothetical protein
MLQRFLDPATLASISSLDLVAKTVVDGFVAGLHRSPRCDLTRRRGDAEEDAEKRKRKNKREGRSWIRVIFGWREEGAEVAEEKSWQLRQEFDNVGTLGRGSDWSTPL